MDDEIERLVVSVRADTNAFAGDVAAMKAELDGPLAKGAEQAGRSIENALGRAIRTGKFGFDDLKRVALAVLAEIATASLSVGAGATSGGLAGGSEEHTSELQSLMRISYAVFCLKKKKRRKRTI